MFAGRGLLATVLSTMSELPSKSPCVFCNIVNRLEPTELLYEDEEVCVFRDIKPASKLHVLAVPRVHIEDARLLTAEHKPLVERMLAAAKEVLTRQGLSASDARFGYHWPPFRTVHHLHLHAIAPESEMGLIGRVIFRRDSFWFVSTFMGDSVCVMYADATNVIIVQNKMPCRLKGELLMGPEYVASRL